MIKLKRNALTSLYENCEYLMRQIHTHSTYKMSPEFFSASVLNDNIAFSTVQAICVNAIRKQNLSKFQNVYLEKCSEGKYCNSSNLFVLFNVVGVFRLHICGSEFEVISLNLSYKS